MKRSASCMIDNDDDSFSKVNWKRFYFGNTMTASEDDACKQCTPLGRCRACAQLARGDVFAAETRHKKAIVPSLKALCLAKYANDQGPGYAIDPQGRSGARFAFTEPHFQDLAPEVLHAWRRMIRYCHYDLLYPNQCCMRWYPAGTHGQNVVVTAYFQDGQPMCWHFH